MATSNLHLKRPSSLWHVEGLLSVYATILAILAVYSFSINDYWVGFFLISNIALLLVTVLGLHILARHAWEAILTIAVGESVIVGLLLPLHLSTVLVFTLLTVLTFSPLIILTLTDWNLEAFVGKEFVYAPVVHLRLLRRR